MVDEQNCPLCQKGCESMDRVNQDSWSVGCRRCGDYDIEVIADSGCKNLSEEKRALLSGVTRRAYENSQRFLITIDVIKEDDVFDAQVRSVSPRSVAEKANMFLLYLAKKSEYQPTKISVIEPHWDYPIAFCRDRKELDFHISHLVELGLVKLDRYQRTYGLTITFKGWEKIEQMAQPNQESRQAFVAMWFDKKTEEAFSKGIKEVEEDTGYDMMRVDMQEHNEKICDRIIAEIRKSRFLVADVTGHRQGVYFEAGYAMGLGLPVIWTCHEDEKDECHFDTRQYNHIFWKTPEELKEKLLDRILATIR